MQKNLILKWVPKVIHINPWAFVVGCVLLAIVGGVLFYSITSSAPLKQKTSATSPMPVDTENDKRWYQNVPDAAVRPPIVASLSASSTAQLDTDLSRQKQALLKAAMDSPLKAPLNDSPLIGTRNNISMDAPEQTSLNDTSPVSEKENFMNKLSQATDEDILHQPLKKPFSPFILQAGTLLPATLAGGMNSELPGQLTAIVNQNVYDSISGHYLLVPQGTKLILVYDANVAYGQKRLLVAVKRLIFPNGASMDLQGMPAVDASGQAGLHDQVNNHYTRLFGSAAMLGLITGGFQLSQPAQNNPTTTASTSQVMASALGEQMGQVSMGMMNKNLDIAPELIIRPGYLFNVQVTKDLLFPGAY